MRATSELKFNPIKFSLCSYSGSAGSKGSVENFFRSPLTQNIAYSVSKKAKTVNDIAADLGVSPVYIESEAEYLEEYGFLIKQGNKYLINFLIEEPDEAITNAMNEMYGRASKIFANELFDSLNDNPILDDDNIVCCNRMVNIDEEHACPVFENDRNFLMWALIPYITAFSGEKLMDKSISFEEACTIRPDGGKNICYASVENEYAPKYIESMRKFHGMYWNGFSDKFIFWTVDSEWSGKRADESYFHNIGHILSLFEKFFNGDMLTEYDYACMYERGYLRKYVSEKGEWLGLQIPWIRNKEARSILLSYGDRIKEKYKSLFDGLKKPYIQSLLSVIPKHLYKMRMYGLQYIFYSDGWFILHCMKELVNNGKLKLPTEEQKKSLTTLIAPNI